MSVVYTFIATKSTYAATIPLFVKDVADLARRVRNTLSGNQYPIRVGELRDFPLAVAIENFLLCDGSEVGRLDFPELYDYLGDSQGAPANAANFLLPNYLGAKDQSPDAPPQTIDSGAVGIGTPQAEVPVESGETGGTVGNPPSGGRPRSFGDNQFEQER